MIKEYIKVENLQIWRDEVDRVVNAMKNDIPHSMDDQYWVGLTGWSVA